MMLSDLLRPNAVVVPLHAASREQAVSLLVDALDLPGAPKGRDDLKSAILSREEAGSTGIGNGVAIPHARTAQITSACLAVARAAQPIDFKSADGKPATLVFLLAVPDADPKSHLAVLAALSRMALNKKLLRRLNKAASPDGLRAILANIPI
jgi:fructose-specific phosphotransferase system IIA component